MPLHLENLQLQHLYRSLDFLGKHKEKIEKRLFNLKPDVVFYDTISIYFEGKEPEGLAKKGVSRNSCSDTNQVIIGILMTGDAIPIGCKIFPGSIYDSRALKVALNALSRRF